MRRPFACDNPLMYSPRLRTSGFTLVEMAVVLAVIALLIGGVMAGTNLNHTAELRSVATDFTRYATSVRTFRDQYNGLPGDLPNATKYWGVTAGNGTGTDVTCVDATSIAGTTCNGSGNNWIDFGYGSGYFGEINLAWQQMALAGFVEGRFAGGSAAPAIGVTAPGNKYDSQSGFSIATALMSGSFGEEFSHETDGVTIFYGRPAGVLRGANLRVADAAYIDTKIDDGKPDTGMLINQTDATGCYTGTYPTAAYNMTNLQPNLCILRYTVKF